MKLSRVSIAVLVIQLVIVSSIAAKYLYQRWTCPRAWTRAVAYDPELVMRGRYISARLYVDACGTSLPSTGPKTATRALPIELDQNGNMREESHRYLFAKLRARNGRLNVLQFSDETQDRNAQMLLVPTRLSACADAHLDRPVDFYLSETAKSPFPLAKGQQLWVEVTVPPKGPPRPLGLALKDADESWHPLNYR